MTADKLLGPIGVSALPGACCPGTRDQPTLAEACEILLLCILPMLLRKANANMCLHTSNICKSCRRDAFLACMLAK